MRLPLMVLSKLETFQQKNTKIMRIKIEFTKPGLDIPIHTQKHVNSYIHTCLGRNNEYHDAQSQYSISNLKGGKLNDDKKTLSFNGTNPYIVVTSEDETFLTRIVEGLNANENFAFGMKFNDMEFIAEDIFDGWNNFYTLDPILLKERKEDGRNWFVTIEDKDFATKLHSHIINKFSKVDPTLKLSDLELHVGDGKKKKIMVKDNVWAIGSAVKIKIKGNKKLITKLYNYGLGQSTGSGFGTIYKVENLDVYKF